MRAYLALRCELSALRFQLALIRGFRTLEAIEAKANFNPNEPRVPAGSREGGQWTGGGGGGATRPHRVSSRLGPTRGGSIPTTPHSAPHEVSFTSMQPQFDALWRQSFPGGKATEQGGTLRSQAPGVVRLTDLGGLGSSAGEFRPNLTINTPNGVLQGTFHTHPYDEGWTGMSLSGGDAASLVNGPEKFSIAQSGTSQFMFLKTDMTPSHVDFSSVKYAANFRLEQYMQNGWSHSEASTHVALELAKQYHFAYYEGSHGVLRRVYP